MNLGNLLPAGLWPGPHLVNNKMCFFSPRRSYRVQRWRLAGGLGEDRPSGRNSDLSVSQQGAQRLPNSSPHRSLRSRLFPFAVCPAPPHPFIATLFKDLATSFCCPWLTSRFNISGQQRLEDVDGASDFLGWTFKKGLTVMDGDENCPEGVE